ncbi:MAG: phage integrase SAM-like domain-containing protein [Cytophagales bacterium]|nr:phage integrase SAM-like domain-containing protein [Cytophagales bacterium]
MDFLPAAAANEASFLAYRSRTAPIKATMQRVEGLPKQLCVFQIKGSRYWQVRIFSNGRYIAQSLKSTSVTDAFELAKDFYARLVAEGRVSEAASRQEAMPKLSKLANQMRLHDLIQLVLGAEQQKVARDEIKLTSYHIARVRLEGFIFDFFKTKPLAQINTETIESFVNFLTAKKLTTTTIQGYLVPLRRLLQLCIRQRALSQMPLFPNLKAQPASRGAFTLTEYKKILRCSKELRGQTFDEWNGKRPWITTKYHIMPIEMNWLIRFMVYTFIRPGDIRQLKNQHIEIVRGEFHYLRITSPEIKRHNAPCVSLAPAVSLFERLLAYNASKGFGKPSDYVFFPAESNRALVLDVCGWLFNWILNTLQIKQGPHGISRSLYSLRHTSITFRLIYGGGIDLLTLAKNARTSVEMIEKFYASTLSAEMNVALLHSRRR